MGKTYRQEKGDGFEYWSRRPSKQKFPIPGKASKKETLRIERRISRDEIFKEVNRDEHSGRGSSNTNEI